MCSWRLIVVLALAPLLARAAGAEDAPNLLELRSALKGTLLMTRAREVTLLTPEEVGAASFWRLRLEPRAFPARWLTLFGAYEQRLRVASSSSALSSPGLPRADATAPFRVVALEGALSNGPSHSWWHEVDRLALSFHLPKVELTIGRQALGWGRGMMFGAVDVFAPFTPLEVDREWRRGVDAVRLDVQVGPKASVELVGVFGDHLERSAFAGRARGYLGPVDAELVGGWRAKDWFVGVTASASVFDAELHGELAAFFLPEPWRYGGAFGNDRLVLKAVLGASYQFALGEGLTAVVEYHASGFGLPFPVSALDLAFDSALQTRFLRGDFQILGRHVLAASVSYPVDLTLATSLQVLVDPLDGSGVVAPTVSWDFAESVSLLAGGYVGWGALPRSLELRSQLGATPITVVVQVRVYDQRSLPRRTSEPVN